jgi:hypothetical protein
VTQSDDRRRAAGIREASRLRAVMGSEPSSGYAFHDQVRAERFERVRPASADKQAKDERAFAHTPLGGTPVPALLAAGRRPENAVDAREERKSSESLPPIPNDLAGSVDEVDLDADEAGESSAPKSPRALVHDEDAIARRAYESVPAAGGAIWQAMPSLVEATDAARTEDVQAEDVQVEDAWAEDVQADVPRAEAQRAEVAQAIAPAATLSFSVSEPSPHGSRSAAYRPSAAELEAEHRHAYGDPRVLKYEALVERNAWEQISDEISRETALSPALCLLHIVARRESMRSDPKETTKLTEHAISTIAHILRVQEASPTALVISKRLLRKNPGWSHQKQASTGLSLSIMLFGIAAGTGIGWLVTMLLL